MNQSNFFLRRRDHGERFSGTSPLLAYRASALPRTTTSVTNCPNVGQLGNAFDLVPSAGMQPPLYMPDAGEYGQGAVFFSGGDVLETLSQLPDSLSGTKPRLLLLRMKLDPRTNLGGNPLALFGSGQPSNDQLADMCVNSSMQVFAHEYYRGSNSSPAADMLSWCWVGYCFAPPDPSYDNSNLPYGADSANYGFAANMAQWAILNKTTSTKTNEIWVHTAASGVRLGGGYYSNWNFPSPGFWVSQFLVYNSLPDQELANLFS